MKNLANYTIRDAHSSEFPAIGKLTVEVYSKLDGFPSQEDNPEYYQRLSNIGGFTEFPETRLLVAVTDAGAILGSVVYCGDMAYYGSGGSATSEKNASGFRLLAVDPSARGMGVGKALTNACINLAKEAGHAQLIIHTTDAMQPAWRMYEKIGFTRSEDLDFLMKGLPVYGFRLSL